MQQLNTVESLFVFMNQRGPGMAMAMMQVFSAGQNEDPVERYEKIVARVKKAIPLIPLLHQKILRVPGDVDKPYWITEGNVDIDYHVRRLAIPHPGSWNQLTEIYGQLCSLPMDMEMPLWRVYIIEGLNGVEGLPPNSYAVITKMHHASADGITAAKVTAAIAGAPIEQAAKREEDDSTVPGIYDVLGKSVLSNLNSSAKLGRELVSNISSISKWAMKSVLDMVTGKERKEPVVIPKTRFNTMVSPDRVFDSVSFSRNEIKALREKTDGATINDIALTICGGALREYLQAKGELPKESLAAFMPISVRTDEISGNQFTAARILLGTNIANPVARLKSLRAQSTESKEKVKAMGGKRFNELTNIVPGSLLALVFRNAMRYGLFAKVSPLANCLISSVPGSPTRISFGDNELVYMNGSPPIMDGCGLIFGILGYDKDVIISMTSCKQMVPDKAFMLSCLQKAYDDLVKEVEKQAQAARKEKPVAKVKADAKPPLKAVADKAPAPSKKPAAKKSGEAAKPRSETKPAAVKKAAPRKLTAVTTAAPKKAAPKTARAKPAPVKK